MLDIHKHTAILIFANTSAEEVKRKKIANGQRLFEHLNEKAFLEAQKTGLDIIHYSEELQQGNSFGERFSNAIAAVFSKGYENVITIGNDSPDLKAHHLNIAKENLQKNILTLGPSLDGGAYLITVAKQEFNKQKFAELPWQTSKVFTSLQNYLKTRSKKVKQLKHLKDVDSITDLHYFLARFKHINTVLKDLILNIISSLKKIQFIYFFTFKEQHLSLCYNKGSPLKA